MKDPQEVQREKLMRKLARVNRRIAIARKNLTRIQGQLAVVQPPPSRAA